MGMQTGPADWTSRVGRVYDGTDRWRTEIQAFNTDFSAWEPGLVLANDGVNSSQKIKIWAPFSKFYVYKWDQR